jgi:periplasmic protein CpxP/Spy
VTAGGASPPAPRIHRSLPLPQEALTGQRHHFLTPLTEESLMKALTSLNSLRTGALALALALGGLAAQAMPGGHDQGSRGPAGMFGGRIEQMLDVANATDAQRSQIDAIMKAARQDLRAQHEAGMKLRQQQMALFAAPNIDAVSIEALRQQMSAAHEAASRRMSQAAIDAARVLTPEQRAKLAEVMGKRMARMQERLGERR